MNMTPQQWLEIGIKNKWCSEASCYVHDLVEMTEQEEKIVNETNEMDSICIPIVRVYYAQLCLTQYKLTQTAPTVEQQNEH